MRPLMMRALQLVLTAAVILGMAPTNVAFLSAVTRRGDAQLVPAGKRAPQVPARGRGQASLHGGRRARRWLRPSLAVATAETGDPLPSSAGTVTPLLYDATLTQRQVDFGAEDKIKVAQMLSDFGMDYIEAGWPTCSAADRVFFIRALDQLTPECIGKLVAMAPLPSEGDAKGPDAVSEALLESGVPNVGVALNVAAVAPVSAAFLAGIGGPVTENLSAVLTRLRAGQGSHRKTVVVHMHNAMHAYRTNAASVTAVASAACSSGADVVLMIDSGGTATPWEIETMLAELQRTVQWGATKLGVSCMEHAELSVASTIYAAKQGAKVLAGSINGFGGCADLATVVPILQLKMGHSLVTSLALAGLTRLSRAIDEQANLPHRNNQPFVGMSAFAHKGGIHVAAVRACARGCAMVSVPAAMHANAHVIARMCATRCSKTRTRTSTSTRPWWETNGGCSSASYRGAATS